LGDLLDDLRLGLLSRGLGDLLLGEYEGDLLERRGERRGDLLGERLRGE